MIPYLAQSRHPLNSQVLAIFFPFATIPATPHYPVFTDRYSPQYGMLMFLLHFMTNTFFSTFLPLSPPLLPPRYWIIQPVQSRARYHPWLLTQISVIPPSSSLSHSPDLGCVRAQRIMFLGRFLVQLKHLLSGGPRLARMWLILDLARNRHLDSENQGTIGNSLWWRYL